MCYDAGLFIWLLTDISTLISQCMNEVIQFSVFLMSSEICKEYREY